MVTCRRAEALFLSPNPCRTLEYLIKHLTHLASFSNMTNMHTRNLALVWAPNLLRYYRTFFHFLPRALL